eukprot:jgi/Tetstr1/428179/TSEL_018230.t1
MALLAMAMATVLPLARSSAGGWQVRSAEAWAGCVVPLAVDRAATSVSFGGSAAAIGISGVQLAQANGSSPSLAGVLPLGITFEGRAELGPDADCAALLAGDAVVASLRLLAPVEPLAVEPSPVEIVASLGMVSNLAQVFVENATVVFSDSATAPLLPSGPTPGSFSGAVVTTIASGIARVESAMSFLNTNATLASGDAPPVNSSSTMPITLRRTPTPQGTLVELSMPAYEAFFPVEIAGGGSANVTITGSLVARGSLQALPPPVPASPPPPAAPSPTASVRSSTLPASAPPGSPRCPPGMAGPECDVCRADAGCAADSPGATCDTSFLYSATTATKRLSCKAEDDTVSKLVPHLGVTCSTSPAAAGGVPPVLAGVPLDSGLPLCEVGIDLTLGMPVALACAAYNCSIPLDGSAVDCAGLACDCAGAGCPAVQGILAGLSTVKLDCAPDGACSVAIKGLPISRLPLSCVAGECVPPEADANFTGGAAPAESTVDWLRVRVATLALIPIAVVLFLLAAVLLFAKVVGGLASLGLSDDMPQPRSVGRLAFVGLGVRVPVAAGGRGGRAARARVARRRAPTLPHAGGLESLPGTATATPTKGPPEAAEEAAPPALALPPSSGEHRPSSKRAILRDVSCEALRGEVLAIMGPSGSGKTTLLSVLAGREGDLGAGARVSGDITVDGGRRRRSFKAASGFVPQDDCLFPCLTVRESVKYAACLRLAGHSRAVINALVDRTIEELRLSHVADTRVGGAGGARGVSGGERRRVSIAMEMVTQPGVLMLDEPTSGLDSYAASSLMTSLRDIAAAGRIVVLTLHQPSPKAFMQLDKVLLLARGERVFYGAPSQVEAHFEAAGFPCERGIPVADHMLEVVSREDMRAALVAAGAAAAGAAVPLESSDSDTGTLVSDAEASELLPPGNDQEEEEEEDGEEEGEAGKGAATAGGGKKRGRWVRRCGRVCRGALAELDVLLWRGTTNLFRSPALLLMHSLLALAMGVAMGFVFFGVDDDLSGQQNRAGGIFFTLAFFAFCSLSTVDAFLSERGIVFRETAGGYYSASSYLLVKVMLDSLLLRVMPAVLYSAPFYFLMGLNPAPERIAVWFAVLSLFSATAGALGMAGTMGCPTPGVANLVMTLVLLVSLVFGGFLANLEAMPLWVSWISYLSIFRYAFEALVVNEVTGSSFSLDVSGYALEGLDANLILEVLGLDPDRFVLDVIVLDALFAAFLATAMVILYIKLPRHGRRAAGRCGWLRACCGGCGPRRRRAAAPPAGTQLSAMATEMQRQPSATVNWGNAV